MDSAIKKKLFERRVCPQENPGGYPGYAELLAGLNDSSHLDHAAMREWLGKDFDPEAFDLSAVNFRLGQVFGIRR